MPRPAETPPLPADPSNPLFADDAEFWYEPCACSGGRGLGASSFGEVLAVSRQMKAGDYDSWYDAWNAAGDRLAGEADSQLARGHNASARDNYLRAASSYRSSEFFLHAARKTPGSSAPIAAGSKPTKPVARLFDVPIEPVAFPTKRPRCLAISTAWTNRTGGRPCSSSCTPVSMVLRKKCTGRAPERLWSGATMFWPSMAPVDPGPLHREDPPVPARLEEVSYASRRLCAEAEGGRPQPRIALLGTSMGGELAPRAAAFEPRPAACIANDGLYDFAYAFLAMIPPEQRESFVAKIKAPPGPWRSATADRHGEGLAESLGGSLPTVRGPSAPQVLASS